MTYGDILVAVTQHSDEHVDEYDYHNCAVGTQHKLSDKLSEGMVLLQLKVLHVYEAIDCKVQRLQYLEQTARPQQRYSEQQRERGCYQGGVSARRT